MHKLRFAGCDVSKDHLDACLRHPNNRHSKRQFDNSPAGHQQLLAWLTRGAMPVRVVIEATGNYSLDLALTLHAAGQVELMVANPRATKKFAAAQMRKAIP